MKILIFYFFILSSILFSFRKSESGSKNQLEDYNVFSTVLHSKEGTIDLQISLDSIETIFETLKEEVKEFFGERTRKYMQAGGDAARLLYDPGIGFGKTTEHNLTLLRRIEAFVKMGPVVLGVSRKSFIGKILGSEDNPLPPEDRLEGSLAVACMAAIQGVRILRVHDVGATRRALRVMEAVAGGA